MSEIAIFEETLEHQVTPAEIGGELGEREVAERFDEMIERLDEMPLAEETRLDAAQRMPKDLGMGDSYGKWRPPGY